MSRPTALVTGGSRGIGLAVATELTQRGYDVAIGYRQAREQAEDVVRRSMARVAIQADVSDEREARRLVDEAASTLGGLDVLVSNAGINPRPSGFADASSETVRAVVATNLLGTYWTAEAFASAPAAQGNRSILIMSSVFGSLRPSPGAAAYAATKAAVSSLTQSLARALAPEVRVNAVAPGLVETELLWTEPDFIAKRIARTPLGRIGRAEDVARCVAFLVSAEADFITGAIVVVDGGISLG